MLIASSFGNYAYPGKIRVEGYETFLSSVKVTTYLATQKFFRILVWLSLGFLVLVSWFLGFRL